MMILEYHKIDYPEERWTRTPENFRRDLETPLRARLPAGQSLNALPRRPDHGARAARLRSSSPSTTPRPASSATSSATARWRSIPSAPSACSRRSSSEQPDFGRAATFFVLPGGQSAEPPLQPARARRAASSATSSSHGYEIGNHTLWHANLAQVRRDGGADPARRRPGRGCRSTCRAISSAPWRCRTGVYPREVGWAMSGSVEGHELPPRRDPDGRRRRRPVSATPRRSTRPASPASRPWSATSTTG